MCESAATHAPLQDGKIDHKKGPTFFGGTLCANTS